jgi:hypothetical protein
VLVAWNNGTGVAVASSDCPATTIPFKAIISTTSPNNAP